MEGFNKVLLKCESFVYNKTLVFQISVVVVNGLRYGIVRTKFIQSFLCVLIQFCSDFLKYF